VVLENAPPEEHFDLVPDRAPDLPPHAALIRADELDCGYLPIAIEDR
jgi:hypothetical protein